jgi:hypothetical protein
MSFYHDGLPFQATNTKKQKSSTILKKCAKIWGGTTLDYHRYS